MIKVLCLHDEKEYILVGTGYGMYKAQGATGWFQPLHVEGESSLVALCNKDGKIKWIDSEQIRVISVDNIAISDCF